MDIVYSIILAIVQGLTEFIPVSSSGHLVILHDILSFNLTSDLAFDVALHAGTFVAVLIFFAKDIIYYIKNYFKLIWLILLASIPAGLVGLLLEDIIDQVLRNTWIVAIMLVIVGILFIITEKYAKTEIDLKKLNWQQALFVGIAQILALIPGTSRSGITIIAGMFMKLKREQAARFSFLIAIPIFAGATLKKTWDLSKISIDSSEWVVIIIGLIVSGIVGYFCIKYFLKFLEKYPLNWFAYYRFILAFILIIYLIVR